MSEPVFEVQDAWERMADGPFTPYDPWEQLAMWLVKPRWDAVRRWCGGEMDVMRILSGDLLYRAQWWCLWAAHEADIWRAKWDLRASHALSMWTTGITKPLAGLYIGAVMRAD